MREIRSHGSVGEPVGNHRLYPETRTGIAASGLSAVPRETRWTPLIHTRPAAWTRRGPHHEVPIVR